MPSRVARVDYAGPIEKPCVLSDGSVQVPGYIARTGVLVYQFTDGTTVREYRPPEEVFAADSLATWDGLAVCVGHPDTPVTPTNWSMHAKGHVEEATQDGDFVSAGLVIKDQKTIDAIDSGALVELSCGYFMDVEETPGISPAGEPYDQIQRNIIGNHVAMGPRGWGRSGPDVRVWGQDGGAVSVSSEPGSYPFRMPAPATPVVTPAVTPVADKVVPYADYERVCGERDAYAAQLTANAAAVTAADSRIAEGLSLRIAATRVDAAIVLIDVDPKTKAQILRTDREVMVDVIRLSDKTFDPGKRSDDYLRARFDAVCEQHERTPRLDERPNFQGLVSVATERRPATVVVTDANDLNGTIAVDAKARQAERNRKRNEGTV